MSIKTIKSGILKQDWDLVVKGYNDITGESLEIDETEKYTKAKTTKSTKKKTKSKVTKAKKIILPNNSEDGMQFITDESEPSDNEFFHKHGAKKKNIQARQSPQANIVCDGCSTKMYPYQVSKTKLNDSGNVVGKYCNKCVAHRKDSL